MKKTVKVPVAMMRRFNVFALTRTATSEALRQFEEGGDVTSNTGMNLMKRVVESNAAYTMAWSDLYSYAVGLGLDPEGDGTLSLCASDGTISFQASGNYLEGQN